VNEYKQQESIADLVCALEQDVSTILNRPAVPLGKANPPTSPGVYIFSVDGVITYVGEAKGSNGLRDRLLRKHVSGDDRHAIQRAFAVEFPDRLSRRAHLLEHVHVRWLEIKDLGRVSAVERFLIWMLNPSWNLK
jgi:hypothetical protein